MGRHHSKLCRGTRRPASAIYAGASAELAGPYVEKTLERFGEGRLRLIADELSNLGYLSIVRSEEASGFAAAKSWAPTTA